MTIQTLTLGKRKFVILPEKDYRRLQQKAEKISAQDKGDIAEAKRREREPSVPMEAVRKRLRRVKVDSEDYVLHEYSVNEKQAERAYKAVKADVIAARKSGRTRLFAGKP